MKRDHVFILYNCNNLI